MTDMIARAMAKEGITLSDIREPFIICHRGGANIYPENTMEAFRGIVAAGFNVIEMDVHTLSDGALAVMHDSTVDRTTSSTGNVADFTSYTFQNLVVDAPSWFAAGATNTKPVLFDDILREFGNSVIYLPESKDYTSTGAIVNILKKYKLQNNAIIQSFNLASLAPAVNAGIPALFLTDSGTPSSIVNAGVKWVGTSQYVASEYTQSLLDAGLKVTVFTIDRRNDRDTWINKGVSAYFSNDPLWMSGSNTHKRTTDPFKHQTFYHGQVGVDRGVFTGGNRWGWLTPNTGGNFRDFVVQGWACPLTNASYSITATITEDNVYATNSWGAIVVCSPTDYFNDSSSPASNAYNIAIRANGIIDVFRLVNGSATNVGTVNTGVAIPQGGSVTIKVDVSPTSIIVTRTDVVAPNTITVNDTTHRGQYFFFGRYQNGVTFSNVSIT